MDVTKPYKCIGFGAMDVTKPYEFIRFGAMDVTKPHQIIGFGASYGPNGPSRFTNPSRQVGVHPLLLAVLKALLRPY